MKRLAAWLFAFILRRIDVSRPDFAIDGAPGQGDYLHRWYVTRWRGWFANIPEGARTRLQRTVAWATKRIGNVYVHRFVGDDPSDILHDHPSIAVSFILFGAYVEHTIEAGGVHRRRRFSAGALRFMSTRHTHRIELLRDAQGRALPCWTLFFFGPAVREWGFHCPNGWVHWKAFVMPGKPGSVGQGCEP